MTSMPMPSQPVKYYTWTCKCGKVIYGTYTHKEHWVEMMAHVVRTCPLVSKERGRKIMEMIHRDNLGELDAEELDWNQKTPSEEGRNDLPPSG